MPATAVSLLRPEAAPCLHVAVERLDRGSEGLDRLGVEIEAAFGRG